MQGRHAETRRWAKTHGSRPGPSPVDASFAIHGFNLPLAVLSHMLAIGQHASCSFSVTSVCASVLESPTLKCPPMTPPSASPHSFDKLALSPATLANLERLGYLEMTAIQLASLPPALEGKDVIAQAKTGSGKTAAFALALLAKLDTRNFSVQGLVLCPTRELADQVTTEIRRLARAEDNVKVVTLSGGVPLRGQNASLENGAGQGHHLDVVFRTRQAADLGRHLI